MPEEPPILVTDHADVRRILFNRPQVHNAQNTELLESLEEVLEETSRLPDLRAVILGGTGRSFCSGHDLKEIVTNERYADAIRTAEGRRRWEQRLFVRPVEMFEDLSVPTICRVQGNCLAAGMMFMAAADLVIAATDAVFGSPVIQTMAVNDAEVPYFAWLLGSRRAKQALWLDDRLSADEARNLGLVNWVVPPEQLDETIESIVDQLLKVPAETLALSKASLAFMEERRGRRDAARYHFANHCFSHQTSAAIRAADARASRVKTDALESRSAPSREKGSDRVVGV